MPFIAAALLSLSLQQAPPPCKGAPYDDFDFWVGTWDVHGTNGQLAGRNVITEEENGCLLVERWTNTGGVTGQSYNFYDLETESWRQVWVSGGITINYAGGLNEDGSMALQGTIAYRQDPVATFPFRGKWTPNEDGTVTQTFHQYNPQTEEWGVWFIGEYSRAEAE
ncbi:hypothetical protein [Parvularcula marina]|uniref:DUF1579 domain-containing protein n=1 Tax=Parvularcula marina TaxID=2292771 RepID=A0A371RGR7_9PROT|nr:hypothetical protein [Parvularcula marina]RFB04631.1 hypothetical protein DX908_04650 [Parvularcula marina]